MAADEAVTLRSRLVGIALLAITLASCTAKPFSQPTPSASPSASDSTSTSPVSTSAPTPTPYPPAPSGFRPLSLTFVSPTDGWVIGTGACAISCVWIYHTTNGGVTWARSGAPPAYFPIHGCYELALPCVDTVRFATAERGYTFGASWGDVYMTSNGGTTWSRAPITDVSALALAGDDALRLQAADGGCTTGACQLKRSINGGLTWSSAGQPVLTPEGLGGNVFLQSDGYAMRSGMAIRPAEDLRPRSSTAPALSAPHGHMRTIPARTDRPAVRSPLASMRPPGECSASTVLPRKVALSAGSSSCQSMAEHASDRRTQRRLRLMCLRLVRQMCLLRQRRPACR